MQHIHFVSQALNSEYWESHRYQYYTHHCHRGSAFESDWDCGNCDGARCEGCVQKKGEELEFSAPSDVVISMIVAMGVPESIAEDAVYDDFYSPSKTGYDICWPTEDELISQYPDFYQQLLEK